MAKGQRLKPEQIVTLLRQMNCCQFRSTTKESFSIVNHCSKMGWLWMILGTWVSGAGGL